jgi:hypothetical protein
LRSFPSTVIQRATDEVGTALDDMFQGLAKIMSDFSEIKRQQVCFSTLPS